MPSTKKLIGVYRNGELFAVGDNSYVAQLLGRCETYVARIVREGGTILMPDGEYRLQYTGSRAPKPEKKETRKRRPKMSMKDTVAAARKAGMSYGMYVGLMERS